MSWAIGLRSSMAYRVTVVMAPRPACPPAARKAPHRRMTTTGARQAMSRTRSRRSRSPAVYRSRLQASLTEAAMTASRCAPIPRASTVSAFSTVSLTAPLRRAEAAELAR